MFWYSVGVPAPLIVMLVVPLPLMMMLWPSELATLAPLPEVSVSYVVPKLLSTAPAVISTTALAIDSDTLAAVTSTSLMLSPLGLAMATPTPLRTRKLVT